MDCCIYQILHLSTTSNLAWEKATDSMITLKYLQSSISSSLIGTDLEGPMKKLDECVEQGRRVQIVMRGRAAVNTYISAYILAFDKHWNLLIRFILSPLRWLISWYCVEDLYAFSTIGDNAYRKKLGANGSTKCIRQKLLSWRGDGNSFFWMKNGMEMKTFSGWKVTEQLLYSSIKRIKLNKTNFVLIFNKQNIWAQPRLHH